MQRTSLHFETPDEKESVLTKMCVNFVKRTQTQKWFVFDWHLAAIRPTNEQLNLNQFEKKQKCMTSHCRIPKPIFGALNISFWRVVWPVIIIVLASQTQDVEWSSFNFMTIWSQVLFGIIQKMLFHYVQVYLVIWFLICICNLYVRP